MMPLSSQLPGQNWRNGFRSVGIVTIPVDCESVILAKGRHFADDPLAMSHQQYEINCGVPRLISLLAELAIPATFFIPGFTLERHPGVAELILGAGHEIGHHSYAHRDSIELSDDERAHDFERALSVMHRMGITPVGHRAAGYSATKRTFELMADHDFLYDNSLMGYESPYVVQGISGGRSLIEVPPQLATDDFDYYAFLPAPDMAFAVEMPGTVMKAWRSELEAARSAGSLFQLTCHAFLSGRPGRCRALRVLLEKALSYGDIGFMTCQQVASSAAADPSLPTWELPGAVDQTAYPVW